MGASQTEGYQQFILLWMCPSLNDKILNWLYDIIETKYSAYNAISSDLLNIIEDVTSCLHKFKGVTCSTKGSHTLEFLG